jgi:hypothetical protein
MSGKPVALTPKLEEKIERYNYIYNLIMENRQDQDIVKQLQSNFDVKKSQAYKDLHDCRYVHGSFLTIDKGFEVYQQLQRSLLAIKYAIDEKNGYLLVKAIDARTRILELIPDKKDVPWDKVLPSNYFMLFNMGDGQVISLDFSKLQAMKKEDGQKLISEITNKAIDAEFDVLDAEIIKEHSSGEEQ